MVTQHIAKTGTIYTIFSPFMYNIFNVNDIFNVYPTYSKGGNNAEVRIFGSTTEASPFPSHIWRKVKNISENWYQWTSNLPIIPDNGSINTPQCTFLNFRKVTDSQCIEINLILLCRWFGREWYLLRSFWIWNGLSIAIKLSQFPMVVGITLSGKLLLLTDDVLFWMLNFGLFPVLKFKLPQVVI